MKKLLGIILGVLMLVGLIALPATAAPAFVQITQPDAPYQASTTKIDISGLTYLSSHSSITDGTLTVSFDTLMGKRGPVPSGWATWASPPHTETANPHVLITGEANMTMTLSHPVTTFGFELEGNAWANHNYTVDFILMSGPTTVGTISMIIDGFYGARLFAASVGPGESFDKFVIDGDDISGFAIAQVRYVLAPVAVDIDIKPCSDPNSINLRSKGVVPVAVLTTPEFDAATVDPTTVELEGVSAVKWEMVDVCDHEVWDPILMEWVPVGDGDLDLLVYFSTPQLAGVLDASSTEATLTGWTLGGIPIEGTDSVRIVTKGPHGPP
jgi:hypothetical protein